MVVRLAVVCALLAGCGRFGFGDSNSHPVDAIDAIPTDGDRPLETPVELAAQPFSTSSTIFVDVPGATLTIPSSVGTSWILLTSATLASPSLDQHSVEARYLIDGVEQGMGGTEATPAGRPGPWQHLVVVPGTSTPQIVSYQLREAAGAMGVLNTLDAIAVPLPATAVHYASTDPPHTVSAATRTADTTLSLGALSGDFVFMLLVNASDDPTGSDVFVEWAGPAGEVWMAEEQQPRPAWQAFFTMQRATVDSADVQLTLFAHAGTPPSQVRNVRAVAISVDALASVDFARDDNFRSSSSPTPTTTVSLATAPSTARSYVFVGSTVVSEACSASPDAQRVVYFDIDAADRATVFETDNCAYAASHGMIKVLPTRPLMLSSSFASGNGTSVQSAESELLLLGLR